MNPVVIMTCGLFVLAVASGMLGLGVAFSASRFSPSICRTSSTRSSR